MEPFLSEIYLFSFNFAPKGFALCNGQLLPINQNQALFALLGTTYGGNGQTNFALPNLRGRCIAHVGNGLTLGQSVGTSVHTLTTAELTVHSHNSAEVQYRAPVTASATSGNPENRVLASNPDFQNRFRGQFDEEVFEETGRPSGQKGGSQAHENRMPFLVLNYCIALQGIFPSQN